MSSLIAEACEILAEASNAKLEVLAFSRVPWKVDVATDLAVVLEQLPDVLHQLRRGADAILDFYEQGIERALHFLHGEPGLKIECQSRCESWRPQWPYQRATAQNVIDMLHQLGTSFYTLLLQVSPELATHAWMRKWLVGLSEVR